MQLIKNSIKYKSICWQRCPCRVSFGRQSSTEGAKVPPCPNLPNAGKTLPLIAPPDNPPPLKQGGWEGKGGEGAEIDLRTLSENHMVPSRFRAQGLCNRRNLLNQCKSTKKRIQ